MFLVTFTRFYLFLVTFRLQRSRTTYSFKDTGRHARDMMNFGRKDKVLDTIVYVLDTIVYILDTIVYVLDTIVYVHTNNQYILLCKFPLR